MLVMQFVNTKHSANIHYSDSYIIVLNVISSFHLIPLVLYIFYIILL